ncbi:general stress protein [Bacillus norwichensis]|uniref:General stress protein n=1 Tax=Bacillus norwichensis TaxID=2762217 RepID=A0ABR8VS72_9BACI|nr:general stress protein [Bacillus norwichensis]MBD8007603.1 general stress protein [Bacillus norwichensis]
MSFTVVGVYDTAEEVIDVIKTSIHEGFKEEKFSVLAADESKTEFIEQETNVHDRHAASEEAYGIISGFLTGISGGFIVPGLTVPGMGPIIAAGPLASLIQGKSHHDVKDLLITMGLNEGNTQKYVAHLNEGKIILFYERTPS